MPERRPLLRRVIYLLALATACAAFAFSLTGIAGTQGRVKPDGKASSLARQLEQRWHGPCPWARPQPEPEV